MRPFDALIAFARAVGIFAYIPGPAILYATAQTVARGSWAGLMATTGIHIGGDVLVLTAACGLAILFDLVPTLYLTLKLAGAAYLVGLGLQMIRTLKHCLTPTLKTTPASHSPFWQSVTVEVLNPKTALLFVAVPPQFSDPTSGFPIWVQLLLLGTVVNIIFSSADLVWIALAHQITRRLSRSSKTTAGSKLCGGSILIGHGLTVALDR